MCSPSSNTFHGRDDGDCCGEGSDDQSFTDATLSLTCDDSEDNADDSLSDNSTDDSTEEVSIYHSPFLLRKRLLPLAPSPIQGEDDDDYHDGLISYRGTMQPRTLWKKRSNMRVLCFSLSMLAYLFYTTLNYSSMIASLRGQDGTGHPLSKQSKEWKSFHRQKAPKIMQKLSKKSASSQYTIRIKGHRLDLVLQSLDYHAQCPSVKKVQVEWTDPSVKRLPRSVLKHKSGKVEAYGEKSKASSAVFLLDEDVLLKCEEIERAFKEWRVDPSRLVGFYPFHHKAAKATKENDKKVQLRQVSLGKGVYSMLSDRAVFVHNSYLRNFPETSDQCQHLGLSIAVSSVTLKPPVAVMSNPQTTHKKSFKISKAASKQCQDWMESIGNPKLNDQLATIVGRNPKIKDLSKMETKILRQQ